MARRLVPRLRHVAARPVGAAHGPCYRHRRTSRDLPAEARPAWKRTGPRRRRRNEEGRTANAGNEERKSLGSPSPHNPTIQQREQPNEHVPLNLIELLLLLTQPGDIPIEALRRAATAEGADACAARVEAIFSLTWCPVKNPRFRRVWRLVASCAFLQSAALTNPCKHSRTYVRSQGACKV